jgi:hypothetical protein
MKEFRSGATRVLITTDIWARGIDVAQGQFRGLKDAKWIVIRGQLRGHNDAPCGRPNPDLPVCRPGVGRP